MNARTNKSRRKLTNLTTNCYRLHEIVVETISSRILSACEINFTGHFMRKMHFAATHRYFLFCVNVAIFGVFSSRLSSTTCSASVAASHVLEKRSIFNLRNMMQSGGLRRPPEGYLGYGRYCGLGGSGIPVDGVDRCCQAHDKCYSRITHLRCHHDPIEGYWGLRSFFRNYKWRRRSRRPSTDESFAKCGKLISGSYADRATVILSYACCCFVERPISNF